MTSADEFVFAEQLPGAAPARPRTPLPVIRRASTWGILGAILILVGVMITPGPIYQPLGEGIAWNILDLDLTTEPSVTWVTEVEVSEVLGELDGVIVVSQYEIATEEEQWPPLTLIGLDASTGRERWQIVDAERTCQLGGGAVTCVEGRGSPDAVITIHPANGGNATTVHHPGAMSANALDGGDMLVMEGGSEALANLVRVDAEGADVWRYELGFSGLADPSYSRIEVLGGVVATNGGMVDVATGELPTPFSGWFEPDDDGTTRQRTADGVLVTFEDGTEVLVPPGQMWLEVDDAFGGPVSLQQDDDGTIFASWEGGETRHRPGAPECWVYIRVQDALIQHCYDADDPESVSVMALDQRTRELLWERSGTGWRPSMLVTSDTIVFAGEDTIEGLDPRTGESRWSIPVPGEQPRLTTGRDNLVIDDVLIVWTTDAVMRLD